MYTALRVASHVDYRLVFCSVVLLQSEMFTSADVALWWHATLQCNVGVTGGCSAAPRRQVSLEHKLIPGLRGSAVHELNTKLQSDIWNYRPQWPCPVLPTASWPSLLQGWFPSTKHWPLQRTASVSSSVYRPQRTPSLGVKKFLCFRLSSVPKTSLSPKFLPDPQIKVLVQSFDKGVLGGGVKWLSL